MKNFVIEVAASSKEVVNQKIPPALTKKVKVVERDDLFYVVAKDLTADEQKILCDYLEKAGIKIEKIDDGGAVAAEFFGGFSG